MNLANRALRKLAQRLLAVEREAQPSAAPHIPSSRTRRLRDAAAALAFLSGLGHIAQLWFGPLDGAALLAALFGAVYLLLGLGLSGQSRFSVALGVALPALGVAGVALHPRPGEGAAAGLWHIALDAALAALCLYILVQARRAERN